MKEKSAKDNKVIPMTDKLRRYVDYGRLYKFVPMRARISGRGYLKMN